MWQGCQQEERKVCSRRMGSLCLVTGQRFAHGTATTQTTHGSCRHFLTLLWSIAVIEQQLTLDVGFSTIDFSAVTMSEDVVMIDSTPTKKGRNSSHSILAFPIPKWLMPDKFCLEKCGYMEVYLHKLQEIVPIGGINNWASVLPHNVGSSDPQSCHKLLISLVGFNYSNKESNRTKQNFWTKAKMLVSEMLQSLFEHDKDKESIKHCLQQCQTMALFAVLPKDGKKNNSKSGKCIFSWGDQCNMHLCHCVLPWEW